MKYLEDSLMFTVVNRGEAEHFNQIALDCGASGGTIFPVKGTAKSSILRALGLGDTSREAVVTVLKSNVAEKIFENATNDQKVNGVSILIANEEEVEMNHSWKMITVIVNSGFADDIMDVARKAGATGGTVTHARGTAQNTDENRFMGITIVPEKEMIMIACPADKAEGIVKAIKGMDCLNEPGVGIIFTQPVKRFVNLGSNK